MKFLIIKFSRWFIECEQINKQIIITLKLFISTLFTIPTNHINSLIIIIHNLLQFRSGVLQVGDRIIAINNWSTINGTAEEGNQILRQSTSPLKLFVEFDVIGKIFDNILNMNLFNSF